MTLHAIEYPFGQSGWAVHPNCLVGQGGKQSSSPVALKPGLRHSEYSEHLDAQQRPSGTGPKHLELEPCRVSSHKKPWRRHIRRSTEAGYFLLNICARKESNKKYKTVDYHGQLKYGAEPEHGLVYFPSFFMEVIHPVCTKMAEWKWDREWKCGFEGGQSTWLS